MMAGLLLIQPVLWRGLGGLQDRPSTLSALFFRGGKRMPLEDIAIRLIHSFGDLTSAFNLLPKAAATLAIWKARYPQKHKHPLNCNM